jgi:hypothetical protein
MACPAFTFFSAALPGEGALRYWTRIRGSFNHIDAAIEAADPSVSRDEFRRQRVRIVDLICAAEREEDGLKAEGFCEILDCAMEESLVSLQSVPADAVPRVMASCPDIADAIAALQSHGSERVRGLARDVMRGWKASVEDDIVVMSAAVATLDALLQTPASQQSGNSNPKAKKDHQPSLWEGKPLCPNPKKEGASGGPRKTAPASAISRATMADKHAPLKKSPECMPKKERPPCRPTRPASGSTASNGQSGNLPLRHQAKIQENRPLTQKTAPVVVGPSRVKVSEAYPMPRKTAPAAVRAVKMVPSPEEMKTMESTKRKLREGYKEAADAKRQRRIQVIQAPKMPEQRKTHPIMRERNRQRFRRSLLSSLDRV